MDWYFVSRDNLAGCLYGWMGAHDPSTTREVPKISPILSSLLDTSASVCKIAYNLDEDDKLIPPLRLSDRNLSLYSLSLTKIPFGYNSGLDRYTHVISTLKVWDQGLVHHLLSACSLLTLALC